jgi:hypothetical protein
LVYNIPTHQFAIGGGGGDGIIVTHSQVCFSLQLGIINTPCIILLHTQQFLQSATDVQELG